LINKLKLLFTGMWRRVFW